MALQVDTLYTCTPDGRLLRDNDPFGEPAAPRFFFGRTVVGNLWRIGHDLPADVADELIALARAEPICHDAAGLAAEPALAGPVRAALTRHGPVTDEFRGPAYAHLPSRRPATVAPAGRHGITVTPITRLNAALLDPDFSDVADLLQRVAPCIAVVEQGRAVAVCFSSRSSSAAAEAGVETLAAWRRRGYAASTVAAWTTAVRAGGRLPLYSTSWDNLASQGVARRLGLTLIGEDFSIQ
jgi:hypothetical protein